MKNKKFKNKSIKISKENSKKYIKKNIIITILLLILSTILILLTFNLASKYIEKKEFEKQISSFNEKNNKQIFSIDNITLFSSCDAKNKVSTNSNFTLENIYTYTDIAIYINNNFENNKIENNSIENNTIENNTIENTLKSVKIDNIKFDNIPENGNLKLYYKNINNYAKPAISSEILINENLEFDILSEETNDFSKPFLYNNCANPITLSLVHENIKNDYTIIDTSIPITYNGSLLKRCNIPLTSIETSLSFDIYITNNKDEKFKSKVFIKIPYKDKTNNKSIYDGNIIIKPNTNFVFMRYE